MPLSLEDVKLKYRHVFDMLDQENTGKITVDQFEEYLKVAFRDRFDGIAFDLMIAELKPKDGIITRESFCDAFTYRLVPNGATEHLLQALDDLGCTVLSKPELWDCALKRAGMKIGFDEIKKVFEATDRTLLNYYDISPYSPLFDTVRKAQRYSGPKTKVQDRILIQNVAIEMKRKKEAANRKIILIDPENYELSPAAELLAKVAGTSDVKEPET